MSELTNNTEQVSENSGEGANDLLRDTKENQVEEYTLEDLKKETIEHTEAQDRGKRIQLIIFKLGTEEYGLTIDDIKEIVLTPNIAKIPQTPGYIKGVANIRGNIIAIMNLEEKFGLTNGEVVEDELAKSNYTLVVESEAFKAGILVNHVPNTLAVYEKDIDSSSGFLQYSSIDQNYITGIVKSGSRMIILVDMMKLMESEAALGAAINKVIN